MKKFFKYFFISLASILLLVIIAISIALWFVFTPEKLSPLVNRQAERFFNCEVNFGDIEVTFFSSFPNLELKVHEFSLVNPMEGAASDTLVSVKKLTGIVDINAYRKKNEIVLSGISLHDGYVNAYVDNQGKPNFDVLVLGEPDPDEPETETSIEFIDLGNVLLRNINLSYVDDTLKIQSGLRNLDAKISGIIQGNHIQTTIDLQKSLVSFSLNGEKYLDNAAVSLMLPLEITQSSLNVALHKATASVNGLEIMMDGSLYLDSIGDMYPDMHYQLENWAIKDLIAMVPPAFHHHLEGIQVDGLLSSKGHITGIFNDSLMPLMDVHVQLKNGKLQYAALPMPLHDIFGDVNIYTDLADNNISYVQINDFKAKTPSSAFETKGKVTRLFSDMHCNLHSFANLNLQEFNQFIPDTLNMVANGRISGRVHSVFTMSQIENMQIERMRIGGNLLARNLDVVYDSLWVKADRTQLEFQLPNPKPSSPATAFISASVKTDLFEAGQINGFLADMRNIELAMETSDVRDTTRLPDLVASFKMASLMADMDTMQLSIENPEGTLQLSPVKGADRAFDPHIKLAYRSNGIDARMHNESLLVEKISLDADIESHQSKEDLFEKWLVKGLMDLENGLITLSQLTYPLQIPSIKLDFDPQNFNIHQSRMIIDNSDFNLSGELTNILSYFRGDSILRGDFHFVSDVTDVLQLMNLTSGLGHEGDEIARESTDETETAHTHDQAYDDPGPDTLQMAQTDPEIPRETKPAHSEEPYMVPLGIDINLATDIKHATLGVDTASHITGHLRVSDGILLLDEMRFTTPASRMQLTAMYRSPRKNHLFLGLDYHMLDIEIERLLQMIPDLDTIMPMLSSFRGTGEFHIAVETYLDSTYAVKKSTLRGASSIRGNDLVLMDGETFTEIANTLRFTKDAENKVDSFSAEFTIFREEIDIYPFLITMDRYQAVIGGRHNFDMSFDYHIAIVQSPLPFRLGVDVSGNIDNMRFRPARPRYPELYRPTSRRAVQGRQLELRRMIREALLENVAE